MRGHQLHGSGTARHCHQTGQATPPPSLGARDKCVSFNPGVPTPCSCFEARWVCLGGWRGAPGNQPSPRLVPRGRGGTPVPSFPASLWLHFAESARWGESAKRDGERSKGPPRGLNRNTEPTRSLTAGVGGGDTGRQLLPPPLASPQPPSKLQGTPLARPSKQVNSCPPAALSHPCHMTGHPCSNTPGGRGSRATPKATALGTPPRQPGFMARDEALEPDCLGLNPSPASCWLWVWAPTSSSLDTRSINGGFPEELPPQGGCVLDDKRHLAGQSHPSHSVRGAQPRQEHSPSNKQHSRRRTLAVSWTCKDAVLSWEEKGFLWGGG